MRDILLEGFRALCKAEVKMGRLVPHLSVEMAPKTLDPLREVWCFEGLAAPANLRDLGVQVP